MKCGNAEIVALLSCEVFLEIVQCLSKHRISVHVEGIVSSKVLHLTKRSQNREIIGRLKRMLLELLR